MAMNRNMTMAEKEVRDYAQKLSPGGRYGGNCRIGIKMRLCP